MKSEIRENTKYIRNVKKNKTNETSNGGNKSNYKYICYVNQQNNRLGLRKDMLTKR